MKYNCANQRLRRSAAMLTILIGISFQFGCSSRSEKHLREDKVFNRFLQEIKKTPKPALQKLSDIFKEKPNLEILGNVEQEFFDTYTTFTIAGSKTNMRSKKIDGLNFKNNKYMGEIKYNQVKDIKEFRKELILNNAKATADFNLLLCDDFLPLLPKEMNLLNQDLSHGILMDKRMSLNRFSENRARLESPISTSNNQFLKSTFFFSPMGYTKNKESRRRIGNKKTNLDNWTETAPVIPISVQRLVIAYNQVAWESYHHLRRLEKPVEGELSSPMEPPVIEELHFNDFIEYLERWDMRMLYPDPESSDPKVRNLGIAFICQLMSWIENRYYQIFLTNPESPLIVDAVRSIKKFLSAKRAVLLPSNSLDQMLQAALSENILDSPPSNFKFPNFLEVKDLPEKFKLDEVENRMTFAYIPETVFVEAMAKYNFQTLNNEVLTEYRKRKDEKQRLKELKKLRKKRRRERRKKKNAGSTSKASDESTTEKKLQKDTIQAKVEISLNSSMLAIFQLKEHIGLREYVAIPNNGLKKKEALSFAVSLLQKNIQNAISRNLLNKKGGLKLTKARRPIRMDTQPVVWIPKEFLRPKTGKGFKPPREFFETSVYNTQSEAQKTFIPVLNYYYQRAIMALWSKKRF